MFLFILLSIYLNNPDCFTATNSLFESLNLIMLPSFNSDIISYFSLAQLSSYGNPLLFVLQPPAPVPLLYILLLIFNFRFLYISSIILLTRINYNLN